MICSWIRFALMGPCCFSTRIYYNWHTLSLLTAPSIPHDTMGQAEGQDYDVHAHAHTLTICSISVETICMQHMAVARAHTMVEMTFNAHTLNNSSCRERERRQGVIIRHLKNGAVSEVKMIENKQISDFCPGFCSL